MTDLCLSCTDVRRPIFVFGSNLAGRHGKGAALHAIQKHGAFYGEGWGRQGHSYAIPTKNDRLVTLPLSEIEAHVKWFREYARRHDHLDFFLTRVGCGLAGYRDEDMAPLFKDMPKNVIVPDEWLEILTRPPVYLPEPGQPLQFLDDPELWYI